MYRTGIIDGIQTGFLEQINRNVGVKFLPDFKEHNYSSKSQKTRSNNTLDQARLDRSKNETKTPSQKQN